MQQFFLRTAGVLVCLMSGTGIITALLTDSRIAIDTDMQEFIALKKAQPVQTYEDGWTLLAAGDVMLSRFVATIINKEKSPAYPYEKINGIVQKADIAFANLENPVGPGPRMPESGLHFRADPVDVQALQEAGFDIVSLANNHQSDVGQAHIGATIEYVRSTGLKAVGAGINDSDARKPEIIEVKGKKVAFLAYGDPRFANQVHFASATKNGIALADPETMKADIASARQEADLVIISLHAGAEYKETADATQQRLAQAAVEAGAHIVLGHHPHVIQPLTKIGESWVIYSMGNLVFDQMWSEETRRGMIMLFRFKGSDIREIEAIPIHIENYAQPHLATGSARTESLARLQSNLAYATELTWDGPEADVIIQKRGMPLQEPPTQGFSVKRELQDNLNGNRLGEIYNLHNGQVTIKEAGLLLLQTPSDWWVQDFALADTDGDRQKEIILSVWEKDTNVAGKIFPVREKNNPIHNKIYVFSFKKGRIIPTWQSPVLSRPNCEMLFADLDGDSSEELVTLEGDSSNGASCQATTMSVWKWNNWGFSHMWKSAEGRFWNLRSEVDGIRQRAVANGVED